MLACKDQSLVGNIDVALLRAKADWLPLEMLHAVNQMMAEFLMACLRESEDENFSHMCVEELKYYAYDEESIHLITSWLLDEEMLVLIPGQAITIQLQFREKISLMKLVQSSYYAGTAEKEAICERVYSLITKGKVFDDLQSLCNWSLPNPDLKEQLWVSLTDP